MVRSLSLAEGSLAFARGRFALRAEGSLAVARGMTRASRGKLDED